VLANVAPAITNWWLSVWTEKPDADGKFYLGVYGGLVSGAFLLALGAELGVAFLGVAASRNVHKVCVCLAGVAGEGRGCDFRTHG
jgi:hypothetical protein